MGQGNSTHPIHSAGRTGDVCVVRRYLKNPAVLNRRDADGMTCLHWAAQLGQIDIIRELVAAKAMLDGKDINGWTPLMHASCRGHKLAVGALLAAGASVDIESHDGRTALHRAATWKRIGPLDQLIQAGGNVRHEARNKWTPLHCAAAAGDAHACVILIEAGASVDAKDNFGLRPVDVISDLSAMGPVTQALSHGRRHSRGSAQRASSLVATADPPPTRLVPSDIPQLYAADGARDGILPFPSHAREVGAGSGAVSQAQSPQSTGLEHLSASKASEAGAFPVARVHHAGGAGERGVAPKRGSWSRPTGPRPQPTGERQSGGDGNGLRGPVVDLDGERNIRSKKVAVVSSDEALSKEARQANGNNADRRSVRGSTGLATDGKPGVVDLHDEGERPHEPDGDVPVLGSPEHDAQTRE